MDDKQPVTQATRMGYYLFPLAISTLIGCVDGPLYELKKLNPVFQSQWKEDRKRGPTYDQRMEQMRRDARQLTSMTQAEQTQWLATISSITETETSPEIRREAVLAMSKVMQQPIANETIIRLSKDKSEKVRLEVAKSLRNQVTPDATQSLLAMATSDSNESVRLAAVRSLGPHKTEEVKRFLEKQLAKNNPASQESAMVALKDFTGKDFKGDVSMLKRYLSGESVEPKEPTFYQAMRSYFPF